MAAAALAPVVADLMDYIDADIRAAWEVSQIHHDPPRVEDSLPLPHGYLYLAEIDFDTEVGGFCEESALAVFVVGIRATHPAGGTSHMAKIERMDALRALICASPLYHGYNRRWLGETYIDSERQTDEAMGTYYEAFARVEFLLTAEAAT